MSKKFGIVFLTLVAAFCNSAFAVDIPKTWDDIKSNDEVVVWEPGMRMLFCKAYVGKLTCVVSTTVPADMDCVSIHTEDPKGPWVDQGSVPNVRAVYGDGKATCHGRTVKAGNYWGENLLYKTK